MTQRLGVCNLLLCCSVFGCLLFLFPGRYMVEADVTRDVVMAVNLAREIEEPPDAITERLPGYRSRIFSPRAVWDRKFKSMRLAGQPYISCIKHFIGGPVQPGQALALVVIPPKHLKDIREKQASTSTGRLYLYDLWAAAVCSFHPWSIHCFSCLFVVKYFSLSGLSIVSFTLMICMVCLLSCLPHFMNFTISFDLGAGDGGGAAKTDPVKALTTLEALLEMMRSTKHGYYFGPMEEVRDRQ